MAIPTPGHVLALEPGEIPEPIRFGEDFELEAESYTLRRSGRVLKLERIPMEILLSLVEQPGQVVSRDQLVQRVWGTGAFLDTDNSINGAVRKIRSALKDDPEAPRFIQTITGKGYRFIAPVVSPENPPQYRSGGSRTDVAPSRLTEIKQSEEPGETKQEEVSETDVRSLHSGRMRPKWLLIASACLGLAVLAAFAFYLQRPKSAAHLPAATGRVMLAVLPFENLTGDPQQEYFSDGLTEEMITQLGQMDPAHLGVIARTSVMFYKHDPKPLDEIGRKLGIQYVIEGSVRRDAGRVRITAQLIQLKDQTHVWAKEYDRNLTNLLVLQGEIAQEIANETHFALGEQPTANTLRRSAASDTTTSYEAYDLYLKGLYFWNKRTLQDFREAASYFQQAIDKDPNFARAYAGLANTFGLMSSWTLVPQNEFMPKARTAALRALQIDETLAEAHAALALIAENYDYDWPKAEREFRRALELDPEYATAHDWYAEYLSWQRRFDDAFAESERARQLDPISLIIATDRGTILYYSRRYDESITQCHAVLDMDSRFSLAAVFVFYDLVKEGKFPEALHELEAVPPVAKDLPRIWSQKAYVFGEWGRTAEAEHAFAEFEKLAPKSSDQAQPTLMANIGAGRKNAAITLLERAYVEHSSIVTSLKVDPRYDTLREEPRFQELLRRLWPE